MKSHNNDEQYAPSIVVAGGELLDISNPRWR